MENEKTLIICPFSAEAKLLVSMLPDCRQLDAASWQSRQTKLVALNAAGARPLTDYLNATTDLHEYRSIILFGAAGALANEIEPGQVFLCSQVQYQQQRIDIESADIAKTATNISASERLINSLCKNLTGAAQVTVDKPVLLPVDRLLLHKQTGAIIVDMESFFFAEAMNARGLKYHIIRFISDTGSQPFKLPFAANVRLGVIKSRAQILNFLK